jgi:hypothetical protein
MPYFVKFQCNPIDYASELVFKELLVKEICITITPELAEKSGKFDDTNFIWVDILPQIFEKFVITHSNTDYTSQTIDIDKLLEYWKSVKFLSTIHSFENTNYVA